MHDFVGGEIALNYAKRDLATVTRVIDLTPAHRLCVQAGGNLGVFPKFLSMFFEAVITFEPDPDLFRKLVHNVPEQNVVTIQAALGSKAEGIRTSRSRRDKDPKRKVHEGVTHVLPGGFIPTLRLDDFHLKVCDLLYLDLEGYEFPAIAGARETILRCRPIIVVEVNGSGIPLGFRDDDIRNALRILDYELALSINSDEVYKPR